MNNAEHQAAYRKRRTQERERMKGALETIDTRLEGNEKPLAVEIREVAREGLGLQIGRNKQ